MRCFGFVFGALLTASCLIVETAAAEPSLEACAGAYTKGQEERLENRLLSAHEEFELCANPSCPAPVVSDCRRWKKEVEAALPSVLVSATNEKGESLTEFVFYLDGTPRSLVPGEPLLLKPGQHRFRFEAAGYIAREIQRDLKPEHQRVPLIAVLSPVQEPIKQAEPELAAPEPSEEAKLPIAAIVAGSVGVLALGSSVYFGLSAQHEFDRLKEECAPRCAEADAGAVQTKILIADVALATGVAALGAAAWLYFSEDSEDVARAPAIGVTAEPGGAQGRLRLRF